MYLATINDDTMNIDVSIYLFQLVLLFSSKNMQEWNYWITW